MTKTKEGYSYLFIVLLAFSVYLYAERVFATGEGDVDSYGRQTSTTQTTNRNSVGTSSNQAASTTTNTGQETQRRTTPASNHSTTTTTTDSRRTTTPTTYNNPASTSTTGQRLRNSVVKMTNLGERLRNTFDSTTATSTAQTKLLESLKVALGSISPFRPLTEVIESVFTTIGKVISFSIGQHASTQPYMNFAGLRDKWTSRDGSNHATTTFPRPPVVINQNASSSNATTSRQDININNKPNTTNSIVFEIKAVDANGNILNDWQAVDSLVIPTGAQIFLRWSAPEYVQCLPYLNDKSQYSLTAINRTMISTMLSGNTEQSGYDVAEENVTYRIECGGQRNGEFGVDSKSIQVTVQ